MFPSAFAPANAAVPSQSPAPFFRPNGTDAVNETPGSLVGVLPEEGAQNPAWNAQLDSGPPRSMGTSERSGDAESDPQLLCP